MEGVKLGFCLHAATCTQISVKKFLDRGSYEKLQNVC